MKALKHPYSQKKQGENQMHDLSLTVRWSIYTSEDWTWLLKVVEPVHPHCSRRKHGESESEHVANSNNTMLFMIVSKPVWMDLTDDQDS